MPAIGRRGRSRARSLARPRSRERMLVSASRPRERRGRRAVGEWAALDPIQRLGAVPTAEQARPEIHTSPDLCEEVRPMSIEENKSVVQQFYEQGASGAHDDALIAADVIYHGPPMLGEVHGREGFKQILGLFRSA